MNKVFTYTYSVQVCASKDLYGIHLDSIDIAHMYGATFSRGKIISKDVNVWSIFLKIIEEL